MTSPALPFPLPGLSARRLRLASGLVLFCYIAGHLLNHIVGMVSLDAAEATLRVAMAVWQSRPGTALLYSAAALHFAMALRSLYGRHDWRFPLVEIVRLWAGFSLPLLLIGHVATTRLALALHDVTPSYASTVTSIVAGGAQEWQVALLAPGWVHGCLGLWLSLRRYAAMRRWRNALIVVVVAIPLLAAAGFYIMSREVVARGHVARASAPPTQVAAMQRARIMAWKDNMTMIYLGMIGGALLLGPLRRSVMRRRDGAAPQV